MKKALLILGFSVTAWPALAQPNWPSKPVRLLVPTGAGTPIDALARAVAQKLQERFNQSFVVDNKPGANQIIGMEACARSAPDGYTFCIANSNSWTINPLIIKKLPYNPEKQLAPVAILGWPVAVVTVNAQLGAKTVKDVAEMSKRQPTAWNWGSTGMGSQSHLYHDAMTHATGWQVTHVPYANPGQLVPAALSNTIQLYYGTVGSVKPHIDSGKLLPLLVAAKERTRFLPQVPTFKEAGLGDFDLQTWFGMVAPIETAPDILKKMNEAVNIVVKDPAFKTAFLDPQTLEPGGGSLQDFAQVLKQERSYSEGVVKKANIQLD